MVKSRSSTSSIFRAATSTNSISRSSSIFSETSSSGYDTDSIITFRPTPGLGNTASDRHRPPDLQLGHSNKNPSIRHPYTPSLPVTPGTPPTPSQFPSDPFSHPTTLPEPTRSRPGSLAHTLERAGKGPEIVVASPSTSTVHYLFPTSISVSGNHLSAEEGRPNVTRSTGSGSQRKKKGSGRAPVDAFSAPTRKAKEESLGYRTSRTGSEPVIGLKESKTLDSASMRTLRRQPSLADLGTRGRFKGNKENVDPDRGVMTLEKVVEEKRNKSLGLSTKINTSDTKPLSPILDKSNISDPITHPSPNRRRSLSLATPRPAPSIPSPTSPESPQLPAPNFGKPLHIEVGDLIPSGSYTHIEYSANGAIPFTNPFGFPGGVPMSRGSTRIGLGGVDAGKITARLDAEQRLAARNSEYRPISGVGVEAPMKRRLSLSGRVRRSLSLKSETKFNRRRSQSVTARGEKQWDTTVPLPSIHDLGLGDPSVDMDDKYAPAKIPCSRSLGLGLDVDVLSDIGQRSPQRKRIDLGGSDISLLASTVGLGFSPLDSPISLPESFLAEAVDLTGRGRKVVSPQSTGSTATIDQDRTERSSARPTPVLSARSTPYLSESQSTTPNFSSNFTSPMPQTPHSFAQLPNPPQIHQLASPAHIHSPALEDNTTKYTVTSRKPNLRYSKSFSSDVGGKMSRNFSWRGRSSATSQKIPDLATCEKVEAAVQKEKRLSRSLSTAIRTRSPVPPEMRYTEATPPPIVENRPRIVRRPSNGDIHRWRPPTLYSLCSPDGAVDPLPTAPRLGTTPYVSITAPITPDLHAPNHKSPFLAASTSFRGSFKSLTKSLSRTFDRHHANEQVRQADSALKARISGPLESMPEKDRYSLRHRAQPPPPRPERPQLRQDDQEWRETLLSQAVSHSIKDGLCELANTRPTTTESHFDPSSMGRSDRTSWSRSVGKTFGLRSSSSGFGSVREGSGSYSRQSRLLVAEGNTRGLKEVGKEESNMSVYSTASYLPQHPQHRSPIPIQAPLLPEVLPSPPLSSPPIDDIPEFPFVPVRHSHSPPIPAPQPYAPQPLLNKLSSLSANQIPIQGKEERVKKVLNWRREVGDDDALEGMIVRHVEREGEVLRGIMNRTSVGPGLGL